MPEPATAVTPEAPAQAPDNGTPAAPSVEETDWKAEARKWEQRAKDNKTAADELAQIKEASKTELERAQEAAATAAATATKAQQEALRLRVAVNKGLPASLVDRLRGSNEEEMTADADELLKLVTPQQGVVQPAGPRPDLSQGARGGTATQGDPAKEFEVFLNKQLNH